MKYLLKIDDGIPSEHNQTITMLGTIRDEIKEKLLNKDDSISINIRLIPKGKI